MTHIQAFAYRFDSIYIRTLAACFAVYGWLVICSAFVGPM